MNFSPSSKHTTIRMKNEIAKPKQKLRMCMHLWRCRDMHDAHAHLEQQQSECKMLQHTHTWTQNIRGPREPPDEYASSVEMDGEKNEFENEMHDLESACIIYRWWWWLMCGILNACAVCAEKNECVRRSIGAARNNWILLSMRDVCIR